jgi:hypothetical protein
MFFRILAATSLLFTASSAIAAPTKPKPASALVITNAREVRAIDVAVGANGQTVRLTRPLGPNAKATLKLPKMSGCMVAIAANFEDETAAELGEFDTCQDSTVRLTD